LCVCIHVWLCGHISVACDRRVRILFLGAKLLSRCCAGHYTASSEPGKACSKCPPGGTCAGKLSPPVAQRDWWGLDGGTLFTSCEKDEGNGTGRCLGGVNCSERYTGRLCQRCRPDYYPWFQECLPCPDDFGWTARNTLTVIYRYGIIWLTWIVVNRFLCEQLQMADSLLNFAQIAGTLGGFDLDWPESLVSAASWTSTSTSPGLVAL